MNQDLTVAGLLHDLNNVFQMLVDAAELLSEDARWSPLSAAILRSVERGRRVTSSLESGRGPSEPFETILESAIAFVEDSLLARPGPAVEFICEVEPGIELPGNWAWERVLINLFLNSLRAMPEGGTILVRALQCGPEIRIEIRDSGYGIDPEVQKRLFGPGISTKPGGGLGLHVVEAIVKENGGTVRGSNRADGPGAEFVIALPRQGTGASGQRTAERIQRGVGV
ncbi:MAG TPA: HAMP domain-containing sensor histidine kinase [Bryobacteraceae bacterium]|nr:HAMP domain-containing sensor histidine kinase [Bryobacteraceae bacterium]